MSTKNTTVNERIATILWILFQYLWQLMIPNHTTLFYRISSLTIALIPIVYIAIRYFFKRKNNSLSK